MILKYLLKEPFKKESKKETCTKALREQTGTDI
jgi:hypothetical protein